jgi:hypothetical protein
VLAAVQASVLRTDRFAAAGLDRVCAQRQSSLYVMADKTISRQKVPRNLQQIQGGECLRALARRGRPRG